MFKFFCRFPLNFSDNQIMSLDLFVSVYTKCLKWYLTFLAFLSIPGQHWTQRKSHQMGRRFRFYLLNYGQSKLWVRLHSERHAGQTKGPGGAGYNYRQQVWLIVCETSNWLWGNYFGGTIKLSEVRRLRGGGI